MGKRKTRQQKIITRLRQQLKKQKVVTSKKDNAKKEPHSIPLDDHKVPKTPDPKKTSQTLVLSPKLIKKDLVKTALISIITISLEFVLYFVTR